MTNQKSDTNLMPISLCVQSFMHILRQKGRLCLRLRHILLEFFCGLFLLLFLLTNHIHFRAKMANHKSNNLRELAIEFFMNAEHWPPKKAHCNSQCIQIFPLNPGAQRHTHTNVFTNIHLNSPTVSPQMSWCWMSIFRVFFSLLSISHLLIFHLASVYFQCYLNQGSNQC